MKHPILRSLFLLAAILSPSLLAQVGPGFSRKPQPSWIIITSFNSVPGDDIRSVHHTRLKGDKPATWTTALTVNKLP